ncbi:DUF4238 domain-containing protein [Candidatus Woesebacteria bacterium]|nr:DUF4238 domain-containing protein [Candidatus Woesebacteria bacterium]
MARKNVKHHKIPATYLHGFTDSNGQVWISDKTFNIYPGRPESVLSESDYYTIRFPTGGGTLAVETEYLKGIEGNFTTLYKKKIKNREPIDQSTKAELSIFVASMLERQPSQRTSLEKFFNDVREKDEHLKALSPEAKKRFAQFASITQGNGIPAEDFLEMGKDIGSLHTSMIPEGVQFLAPIIFDMKWAFLIRKHSDCSYFMTSDHPCTLMNPFLEAEYGTNVMGSLPGFIQKDVELTIPLSSEIVLFCGWNLAHDCLYIPIDEDNIGQMNYRSRRGATVVISSDKAALELLVEKASRNIRK